MLIATKIIFIYLLLFLSFNNSPFIIFIVYWVITSGWLNAADWPVFYIVRPILSVLAQIAHVDLWTMTVSRSTIGIQTVLLLQLHFSCISSNQRILAERWSHHLHVVGICRSTEYGTGAGLMLVVVAVHLIVALMSSV